MYQSPLGKCVYHLYAKDSELFHEVSEAGSRGYVNKLSLKPPLVHDGVKSVIH